MSMDAFSDVKQYSALETALREATDEELKDIPGIGQWTVNKIRGELGYANDNRRQVTERELLEKYWGKGLTLEEVADEYSVTTRTVQEWFEWYNIPTRRSASQKQYWPFAGSLEDAVRLLDKRDDLFIRLYVDVGCNAYWFYKHNGSYWLGHNSSGTSAVYANSDLVQSYFESYDPEICYCDEFENIP